MKKQTTKTKIWLTVFCVFAMVIVGVCWHFKVAEKIVSSAEAWKLDSGELSLHAINVGSGDALVVILPDRKTMLIDTGDNGEYKTTKKYYSEVLKLGKTLDYLVITHPHSDHFGEGTELLADYDFGEIFLPFVDSINSADDEANNGGKLPVAGGTAGANSKSYGAFIGAVYAEQTKITYLDDAAPILGDGYTITFWTPNVEYVRDHIDGSNPNPNDISAMMTIEYKNKVFVLTGDATGDDEAAFMSAVPENFFNGKDVYLKVAHHGSNTEKSNGAAFLNFIKPKYAMISAGKKDKKDYGLPSEAAVSRIEAVGAVVFATLNNGNIVFEVSPNGTFAYYLGEAVDVSGAYIGLIVVLGLSILYIWLGKTARITRSALFR
ncbi:MAG: MBL fold metallo-hydrolase [Christensenellaceae bacterium]|jgi:competence protein ComEC|nr:MBL fold metallo-hydrolase [Christensenellaceae bacterium]